MGELNIGTLVALLRLQDEMSPALLTASQRISSFGGAASSAGLALTAGLTVPLAALAVTSIDAAIGFESAFAGVSKTAAGVVDDFGNLTAAGEALQQGLRDMAMEVPIGVEELAKLAEVGGQLGVQTESLLEFTRVAADMGVSTNLSAEQAALALAKFATVTGVVATDGVEAYSRLGSAVVALGNAFAADEAEILEFGQRLAGAGTIAGMSAGEILGLGTALASVGVNAEAGGTALSRVIIDLANAAKSGGEELDKFAAIAGMTSDAFANLFAEDPSGALLAFVEGLARIDAEGGNVFETLQDVEFQDARVRNSLMLTLLSVDELREAMELGTSPTLTTSRSHKKPSGDTPPPNHNSASSGTRFTTSRSRWAGQWPPP